MMPKTRMKVAQDYTVFNYIPPIPHNNVNNQGRMIVVGTGVNLETQFILPGNIKEKDGK